MDVGTGSGHRRELRDELAGIMRRLHEIQRELGERPARIRRRPRPRRRQHRTLAACAVSAAGGAALTAVVIGHPPPVLGPPQQPPAGVSQTARPRPTPHRAKMPPPALPPVRRRQAPQRQSSPSY